MIIDNWQLIIGEQKKRRNKISFVVATITKEYGRKSRRLQQQVSGDYMSVEERLEAFKVAYYETKAMLADIAVNGVEGYKTLDDLLNEKD